MSRYFPQLSMDDNKNAKTKLLSFTYSLYSNKGKSQTYSL